MIANEVHNENGKKSVVIGLTGAEVNRLLADRNYMIVVNHPALNVMIFAAKGNDEDLTREFLRIITINNAEAKANEQSDLVRAPGSRPRGSVHEQRGRSGELSNGDEHPLDGQEERGKDGPH